jgi:hypothetical protein
MGASALHSCGFDENVPPIHSDSIRAAVVLGSELEMHVVVSCSDGVGVDASHSDDLGCGAHTLSGVAGLVVDMGTLGMVEGAGGDWGIVRGHPSISLLPLFSPTLHLFICIPLPHLCTIFKDHT